MEENKYYTISRNYSRKEHPEMFSLTVNREVDQDSSYQRRRAESYIALYDVQIQLLEEMTMFKIGEESLMSPKILTKTRREFAERFKVLKKKLQDELDSGELTEKQGSLIEDSLEDIELRVGSFYK